MLPTRPQWSVMSVPSSCFCGSLNGILTSLRSTLPNSVGIQMYSWVRGGGACVKYIVQGYNLYDSPKEQTLDLH